MSSESTIHRLLPWYVAGTLDESEAESFRRHLAECESCRAEMDVLEQARRALDLHGPSFLDDHPTAELLVAAVRGEPGHEVEAARVRRHLAFCSTCALEARWIVGAAAPDLAPAAAAPPVPPPARRGSVRPLLWTAVLAAAVALFALPWWLVDRGGAATGIVALHYVAPVERAGAGVVIEAAPGDDVVRMLFEIDLAAADFPFAFELRNAVGGEVFFQSGIGADALLDGYLPFLCARRDCPAGRYTARAVSADAGVAELSFDFTISARE